MEPKICIFEDEGYKNLLPLTYLKPVYGIRCGIFTLQEKIEKYYKGEIILHSRKYLANCIREMKNNHLVNKFDEEKILFINGRIIINDKFYNEIQFDGDDIIYKSDNVIAAARLSGDNLKKFIEQNDEVISSYDKLNCEVKEIDAKLINYPWDIININGQQIVHDYSLINRQTKKSHSKYDGVHLIKEENIHIGEKTILMPTVVLNAEDGPIYIGENVKILPGTYISGPVYIGDNSLVKANTQIYHNTSIGPVCKVGGEIENSIIHSYSNKQHEGFLGHSYLGSWVNIGASSNNSDLKNNYGNIKVFINNEEIDTETQFLGLIMADHSKCGINTMFNTGTTIGVSCNIYGGNFPPKYIPSFSWGGADGLQTYDLRKAIEVAKTVKSRRKVSMSISDLEVFKKVFELTKTERKNFDKK